MRGLVLAAAVAIVLFDASESAAATSVRVYPATATVPARLLRISLVFATPPSETIVDAIALRERGGNVMTHPFADPPLWSADRRTLTLVLDPSRQKTGLAAHATRGYVLDPGRVAELSIDSQVVRRWRVRAAACPPLEPAAWRLSRVRAGSLERLVVRFAGPIDVLSAPYLAIATSRGARARGDARLASDQSSWTFAPATPWELGARLAIHPRLEDPCGNEIGEPFEHTASRGLASDRPTTFRSIDVAR